MLFQCHLYNEWNLSQNFTFAVLSQINTTASFVKVKYLIFKLSSGFLLLPASHDGSGLTFLCIGRRLTHYPAE